MSEERRATSTSQVTLDKSSAILETVGTTSSTNIRPVKGIVVKDIRGSLEKESSDFATYARASEYCSLVGISPRIPAYHISSGHGYKIEEIVLGDIPFKLKKNSPTGEISVSENAVVVYEISDASNKQITGPDTENMVVALRSQELGSVNIGQDGKQVDMTIALREQQGQLSSDNQNTLVGYDVQAEADKVVEQALDQNSLDQARLASPFLKPR